MFDVKIGMEENMQQFLFTARPYSLYIGQSKPPALLGGGGEGLGVACQMCLNIHGAVPPELPVYSPPKIK